MGMSLQHLKFFCIPRNFDHNWEFVDEELIGNRILEVKKSDKDAFINDVQGQSNEIVQGKDRSPRPKVFFNKKKSS